MNGLVYISIQAYLDWPPTHNHAEALRFEPHCRGGQVIADQSPIHQSVGLPVNCRPSCGSTFIVLSPSARSGTCTRARGSWYAARGSRTRFLCPGEFSGCLPALRACGLRKHRAAFGKALVRGPHPLGFWACHEHCAANPQGLGGRPIAHTGINITR